MRKVLISILLVLLIVLAFFTIFRGISIGAFKILSTQEIIDLNDNLTVKIEEANQKIKTDLQAKRQELNENVNTLLENKESYYNLANVSTENEINEASTEELYSIEYLWVRVGRHARSEGVNMKMEVLTGDAGEDNVKNLNFTVEGKYMAIMSFVSSLEDDSELEFRIEGFNLLPSSGTDTLSATFSVENVRIKVENSTTSVNSTNVPTTQSETNDENLTTQDTSEDALDNGENDANISDTNATLE